MRYHGLLDNKRADSAMFIEMNLRCSAVRSRSRIVTRLNWRHTSDPQMPKSNRVNRWIAKKTNDRPVFFTSTKIS